MEHAHDLIRPWRRATIAVSAVAALELLALTIVAIVMFGNPLLSHFSESAASAATPPRHSAAPPATKKPALPRNEVSVMVLNGNGEAGAAHAAADRVQAHGYRLGDVGNAPAVMPHSGGVFPPGLAAEGRRPARGLHRGLARPPHGVAPP